MKLTDSLRVFALASALLSSPAFAVSMHEPPCRQEGEDLDDAKKGLEKCADRLGRTVHEAESDIRCLAELKEVNAKADRLTECRSSKK